MKVLYQGAEAILYLSYYLGKKVVIKKRLKKSYRVYELDKKLRQQRTRREAKTILKLLENDINVPTIYYVNPETGILILEYIEGEKLSNYLDRYPEKSYEIGLKLGKILRKIHDLGIIHNDFTTANIIIKNNELYILDLGMSFESKKIEDMAYDILVFKKSIKSRHFNIYTSLWESFTKGYNNNKVIEYATELEKRGRYFIRTE